MQRRRRRRRKRRRRRRRLWQGAAAFLRTVACWPGRGGRGPPGPPFISDTCHLAPKLHQKWTEPHQNGSKIKMHQQNLFVSILMPHADHRASEKKVSIEHFINILATVSKQTDQIIKTRMLPWFTSSFPTQDRWILPEVPQDSSIHS